MGKFKNIARAIVSGIASMFLIMGAQSYAVELSDIGGHWAEMNINWMVDREFISGYPGGYFKPNNPVTRAEFAAMIVKAGTFDRNSYRGVFSDVKKGDWHDVFTQTAYDKGWVMGSGGKFRPNDKVSRVEMSVIIGRIVKIRSGEPENGRDMIANVFQDRDRIPSWATEDMAYAIENGIMKGVGENRFEPLKFSTRAEAATTIYNALKFFGNVD